MTTIYLAGDSTVADQESPPFAGWGQMLPRFFTPEVSVRNRALNGRSAKSFIAEGRLEDILDEIKAGDFLLIQFGHNDQKEDERGTRPFTTYREFLKKYIDSARGLGAFPVLITSVYRRRFDERGELQDTHGDYPNAVRELAREENVPLIDLHKKSGELLAALGPVKSKDIFVHTDEIADDSHFSAHGASEMARLVVEEIWANVAGVLKEQVISNK